MLGMSRPRLLLDPVAFWGRIDERNMSQNQLAQRAGISSGYVSQLVNQRRAPSPATRARLMRLLGAQDVSDLFSYESETE